MALRILLEGRPGVGKTTVARRLLAMLRERPVDVAGFTTEEIQDRGRRVGFRIESASGERATLAHVDVPGPPRVGRYGVDTAAFEKVALPALARPAAVILIDELGKMELLSAAFQDRIAALFESAPMLVATTQASPHPFTDALKARQGVDVIRVSEENRAGLPAWLMVQLTPT